jgi:general secretion pathway protein G
MKRRTAGSNRGFTLVEMMVVISIMLILLAVAVPIYNRSVMAKREDSLRKNVETLNQVIVQYTLDKKKAPRSLEDLKQAHYLKEIPEDITGRTDTWVTDEDESIMSPEQTETGISGVHSGSSGIAIDGTAYSSW